MPKHILLVDGNAPWVRSLFKAMGSEVQVHNLRIYNPPMYKKLVGQPYSRAFRWRDAGDGSREKFILIPGWQRFAGLSTSIISHICRKTIRQIGAPYAIVYTLPQYAGVAERLGEYPSVYHAHDVFRFYGWDVNWVNALEQRMLDACDVVFAVAKCLEEDFKQRTATPVFHCPMAVSSSFLDAAEHATPPKPQDLASLPGKIVGCTGQINLSYDWKLIAELGARLPQFTFVFVGPIIEASDEGRQQIQRVIEMGNVRWLGPREHRLLPAYLNGFDVCFNPLAINDHNNRRSPLRLFDYLSTGRPIVSTAIREAYEHRPHIQIGQNADEIAAAIAQAASGQTRVDLAARRAYIRQHTWEQRGRQFLERFEQVACSGKMRPAR